MIHQVLIFFLGLFSSTAFADRAVVKSHHLEIAKKQVAAIGITSDQADFKSESVEVWGSCEDPDWSVGAREYLMVILSLQSPVKLKGVLLEKGDRIILCDGKIRNITTNQKMFFFKYPCTQVVSFDLKDKMCNCYLAETYVDHGVELLENTKIFIHKDKIYAFSGEAFIKKTKTKLPEGTYEFNNGKPKRRDWDSADTCDGIMIR